LDGDTDVNENRIEARMAAMRERPRSLRAACTSISYRAVTTGVATAQCTTSAGIDRPDAPAPSVSRSDLTKISISRGNRRRMATDVIEWHSAQQKHAPDA